MPNTETGKDTGDKKLKFTPYDLDDSGIEIPIRKENEPKQEEKRISKDSPDNNENFPFTLSELNQELENDNELEPDEELDEEDLEEIQAGNVKKPSFPFSVLAFAIIKDFFDVVSLGLLGIVTNLIGWLVITVYLWGKVGFVKKLVYRKFIFTLILEWIPGVNMIPQWTVFVIRGHFAQIKRVDRVLNKVEELIVRFQKGEI